MSFSVIFQQLGSGMLISISIFVLTLIFSLPMGLAVSFGRMSRNRLVRAIITAYISVMRGTPLMLQLLVIYFGPFYLLGVQISSNYRFIAVIIAFSINYAAYFAEIFRAGIESMPKGQYEAASVLGYSRSQTFMRIIMPQVIKRILPPVTNEVITLIKDTSLAFAISVTEMFTVAKAIAAAEKSMVAFAAAGLFYYIFNFMVAWVMDRAEKSLAYYS